VSPPSVGMQVGTKQIDSRTPTSASRIAPTTSCATPASSRPADRDRARPEQDAHAQRPSFRPSSTTSSHASSRSRRSRTSARRYDPATRPDLGGRPHRHGRVGHEGRLDARRRSIDALRRAPTRSPPRIPASTSARPARSAPARRSTRLFNQQLAQAGERSIPLTLIILLLVFGASSPRACRSCSRSRP
jgi:hypothetical protein